MLCIYDEIHKIYKKRDKSSMFKSSLVHDLHNNLNFKIELIVKVFDDLLEKHARYFKVIEHKSG